MPLPPLCGSFQVIVHDEHRRRLNALHRLMGELTYSRNEAVSRLAAAGGSLQLATEIWLDTAADAALSFAVIQKENQRRNHMPAPHGSATTSAHSGTILGAVDLRKGVLRVLPKEHPDAASSKVCPIEVRIRWAEGGPFMYHLFRAGKNGPATRQTKLLCVFNQVTRVSRRTAGQLQKKRVTRQNSHPPTRSEHRKFRRTVSWSGPAMGRLGCLIYLKSSQQNWANTYRCGDLSLQCAPQHPTTHLMRSARTHM
jgi:hypothetical protein